MTVDEIDTRIYQAMASEYHVLELLVPTESTVNNCFIIDIPYKQIKGMNVHVHATRKKSRLMFVKSVDIFLITVNKGNGVRFMTQSHYTHTMKAKATKRRFYCCSSAKQSVCYFVRKAQKTDQNRPRMTMPEVLWTVVLR